MGNWGQGVALQSTHPFYGLRADITLPKTCQLRGPKGSNYLSIYIGFIAGDDPRAEVGFMFYSGNLWWTSILNGGKASHDSPLVWQQRERPFLLPGILRKQQIEITMPDRGHIVYDDGYEKLKSVLALPISQETFDNGGLLVRACIGWCHDPSGWASFDEMRVDTMSVLDAKGNWAALTDYRFKVLRHAAFGASYSTKLPMRVSYAPLNQGPSAA